MAAGGSNYLIAWADGRSGGGVGAVDTGTDVYGVLVTKAEPGRRIDDFAIATSGNIQSSPRVARSRSGYLAVWGDTLGNPTSHFWLYGARLSRDGTVLDPSGIRIAAEHQIEDYPSVASAGTNYLVVWAGFSEEDPGTTFAAMVSEEGVASVPFPATTRRASQAVVGSNGRSYLVAWQDGSNDETDQDIYGVLLSSTGQVLRPDIPLFAPWHCAKPNR